jgi:hypothetical protein
MSRGRFVGGRIVNAPNKVRFIVPGLISVQGWHPGPHRLSWGLQKLSRYKDDPSSLPICRILPQGAFFLSKSEGRAGWSLVVPGQLQDEPVGGCFNHRKRQVCRLHLMVDGLLRKVHPNRFRLGLRTSWNNVGLNIYRPPSLISRLSQTKQLDYFVATLDQILFNFVQQPFPQIFWLILI